MLYESTELLVGFEKVLSAALISATANQGKPSSPPPAVSLASSPLQMGPCDCCTSLDDADPHPSAFSCYFRTVPFPLPTSKKAAYKRAHLSDIRRRSALVVAGTKKKQEKQKDDGEKLNFACLKRRIVCL